MKKFIFLQLFLHAFILGYSQNYSGGTGTPENPYQLSNLQDLVSLSKNKADWNKHFVQTADINAASSCLWNNMAGFSPIGNFYEPFVGSYNGQNFKIDSLFIDRPNKIDVGLFGQVEQAMLKNIRLEHLSFSGKSYVGGLVGEATSAQLENCFVSGAVVGVNSSGGLVGYAYASQLTSCFSEVSVGCTKDFAGGLAALCLNGTVVKNCYSSGGVLAKGKYAGGLVAKLDGANIYNSFSTGGISARAHLGGLVGMASALSEISDCYSTGKLTVATQSGKASSAGFCGSLSNSSIRNSYATGQATCWNGDKLHANAFIGEYLGASSCVASYFEKLTANRKDNYAKPLKNNDFKALATFKQADWDVEHVWTVNKGNNKNYPVHQWVLSKQQVLASLCMLNACHIQITNGIETDELLVCVSERASNGYDIVYDNLKENDSDNKLQVYSNINGHRLSVNSIGRIKDVGSVEILVYTPENGKYTLNLAKTGLPACKLYLEDKTTGAINQAEEIVLFGKKEQTQRLFLYLVKDGNNLDKARAMAIKK